MYFNEAFAVMVNLTPPFFFMIAILGLISAAPVSALDCRCPAKYEPKAIVLPKATVNTWIQDPGYYKSSGYLVADSFNSGEVVPAGTQAVMQKVCMKHSRTPAELKAELEALLDETSKFSYQALCDNVSNYQATIEVIAGQHCQQLQKYIQNPPQPPEVVNLDAFHTIAYLKKYEGCGCCPKLKAQPCSIPGAQ